MTKEEFIKKYNLDFKSDLILFDLNSLLRSEAEKAFRAGGKYAMKPYTTDLIDEECPNFDDYWNQQNKE